MNKIANQTIFANQAPASSVYRVGPAGSGMLFTTIAAAVAAAVADGHTDFTNVATIEIYPGTYAENVTIGAGIQLYAPDSGVIIQGTVTFNLVAGTAANNSSNLININIQAPANAAALVLTGNVGGTLNCRNPVGGAIIESNAGGAGVDLIQNSNTGGVNLRFFDTTIRTNNVLDTSLLNAAQGITEFHGRTFFQNSSGGTAPLAIKVNNAAQILALAPLLAQSAFTIFAQIQNASAVFSANRCTIQLTNNGGVIFNYTAAGTVRARNCLLALQDATSSVATGTGSMTLSGCQYGGSTSAPFSTIADTVTVNQSGAYGGQRSNSVNEFYVGRGIGYSTIQAAITAANAAATGARKVVLVAPGSYTENLTLQPNVDLVADTQDFCGMNNFSPVTIVGTHTLAFTAINQVNRCKNIRFQSLTTNGTAIFSVSGAFTNCKFLISQCALEKTFAGAAKLINFATTAGNCGLSLNDTNILFNADSGSMIDLSAATNTPQVNIKGQLASTNSNPIGAGISMTNQTAGVPVTLVIINCPAAGGSFVVVQGIYIAATTVQCVTLNTVTDNVQFQNCRISQNLNAGQFFFFNGNGLGQIFNCYLQQNDAGGGGTKLIGENTGAGGTLNYGASIFGFGAVNVRASITTTQLTETLTGV